MHSEARHVANLTPAGAVDAAVDEILEHGGVDEAPDAVIRWAVHCYKNATLQCDPVTVERLCDSLRRAGVPV